MSARHEVKAGIFIITGVLIFAISIFVLGRERQIFARQEQYFAEFSDIKGLSKGAPVRLGGISIGRVEEVGFSKDMSDPKVHVSLLINQDFLDRIRADAKVSIETQGLLGDRFLNISMGTDVTRMPPGSTIAGDESADLGQVMAKAGTVVESTAEIADTIENFLKDFDKDTVENISSATSSLAKLFKEIETGEGLLHKLIYSKEDGEKIVDSLGSAARDVRSLTNEIANGKGVLHSLIYEPVGQTTVENLNSALKQISSSSAHLNDLLEEIKTGQGTVHDLVYNKPEKNVSQILSELSTTAENLKLASEALAKGSGTIGALLVDSQLYDNLVEVTDGAKRSVILRHAIRSSLNEEK
jgi:phospholipid/cholesterol/gamma-HCH transport system substrate-binding protein